MRILLVNHFPLEGSGSGTYTKNLAQHLAKQGHDVAVVFPENQTPSPLEGVQLYPVFFSDIIVAKDDSATDAAQKETRQDTLSSAHQIEDLGTPEHPLPFNFPCFTTHPRSLTAFNDLSDDELNLYCAAFKAAIQKAIDEVQPDIIHAQHVWILASIASSFPIPTILTAHGTDMMGYRKWPRLRHFADTAVEQCRKIIAISRDNYEDTIETIPAAKDKMVLVLNGYNEDIFYREDLDAQSALQGVNVDYNGEPLVLFAGKLTNFKGVDTLLDAAALFEETVPDVITVLAGAGEEETALHDQQQRLALKRTHFIGHQSQDELRRLYNIADVFVVPSRREPFGLVALEAMACGAPVVATNQGGLPEFVTEERGRLVDVDDAQGLADAIVDMLSNRSAWTQSKDARAAEIYENYAQAQFVEKLVALYSSF